MSSIHYLSRRGDIFELHALLEAGADPNERASNDGKTPLMKAVKADNQVAVKLLLRYGADIDAVDHDGRTALTDSTSRRMSRLLLEAGADPDRGRIGKMTLLAFFASFGDRCMVDFLLQYGANPEERTRRGKSVREMLDDPDTHWMAPAFRNTPESRARNAAAVRKLSENLTLSPEEYLARNRNILIFGYHTFSYDDPALETWAKSVGEFLASFELREETYRRYLRDDELADAMGKVERQKRRAERERLLRARLDEFEKTVLGA